MASFSGLGIGLSLVFGCFLLAVVAELYYLLCWKKRVIKREVKDDDYGSNYAKEFFHLICWRKPSSLQGNNTIGDKVRDPEAQGQEPDLELGTSKDLLLKAFGEESAESELMRLHNLSGPPRFLFTINEETKEDLESEDGKSRGDRSRRGSRTRSLSDLMLAVDTAFLTPLASPRLKSPPLNPLDSYHRHGFNPLFESSMEAEINRLRSSPPPKFKFLKDAEEKLFRKLMEEAEKKAAKNNSSVQDSVIKPPNSTIITEETEGSFLRFIVSKNNKERDLLHHLPQNPSSSSQVLPLTRPGSSATFNSSGTLSIPRDRVCNICLSQREIESLQKEEGRIS